MAIARTARLRDVAAVSYPKQKLQRDQNLADGRCINDTKGRTHGPVEPGTVRCAPCNVTHRGSR